VGGDAAGVEKPGHGARVAKTSARVAAMR